MAETVARAWTGGRVFTGRRWAEALVVEDDRVTAVGALASVRRAIPAGAERTDLDGGLLVPGLIDPHLHWLGSVVDAAGIDLRGAGTIAELQRRLGDGAIREPRGPLLGSGWDQERLAEARYPNRSDLDRIESRRPVVLYRICHHAAVVNSAALEALGIGRATPDPPGGRVGRDPSGEPDGLLFDRAMRPARQLSVEAFRGSAVEARAFLGSLAARGLTSVGAMSAVPGEIELARHQAADGPLPVRLRFHLIAEQWDGRAPAPPSVGELPRLVGVKVVLDGSLGARTAWLDAPYTDVPSERGMPLTSPGEAARTIRDAADAGLGVAMHAIGDRAVAAALDVVEQAPSGSPTPRIEHASVLSRPLVDRLAGAGPVLVVQPAFVASDTWIVERVGTERAAWTYPFRTLVGRGLTLAGSSDAPIESFDPWHGMRVLVGRCGFAPEEALRLYTGGGGAALYDRRLGSLEPGACGDAVWVRAPGLADAIAAGGPVAASWCAGAPRQPPEATN